VICTVGDGSRPKIRLFCGWNCHNWSLMCAYIAPHHLPGQVLRLVRLYKKGFVVTLPQNVHQRLQKTLDLLQVDSHDKHLFKPFAAYVFDIFSAGSSYSKFGVIVGIPANCLYEDESSVDKQAIKVRDETIPWELDEDKLLQKPLTSKQMIDAMVAVVFCMEMYGICKSINAKRDLYSKPRIVRLILYCIVGAFSLRSYALCKDVTQVYFEDKIDKELKRNNQGGKEFYTKLLERNIVLRKLLGREGERAYSVLGNENYFIRHKRIPLAQRKIFFEQPLQ
ncbi:transmembrane protein 177, partial [Asbolus verrucosus]